MFQIELRLSLLRMIFFVHVVLTDFVELMDCNVLVDHTPERVVNAVWAGHTLGMVVRIAGED